MSHLYDPEGLNLYYPEDGNDLILEYSIDDGNTWNFLENISTGGSVKGEVEAERVILTVENIPGVYKLRLRHINYVQGRQNYAIDEMYFTGSYAFDGIRQVDRAETRREAWHVELRDKSINLRSHAFWESPPAYWTRDGRTKRPVNIQNIKVNSLGNYKNNYEIVQTSGRRIANNLLVDGYRYDLPLTTQFVKQLPQFEYDTIVEDFSSYSTGETQIAGFTTDSASQVRTRVADNPGKKYFVLRGNPIAGTRFLQTENIGDISRVTYTFIVYVLNGITYDYDFQDPNYGLALEDPDTDEDLVLEYSYDGISWTRKKTIFLGSTQIAPYLREITETVDFSSEMPSYIRFRQTNWSGDAGNEGDNYGLTDISISSAKKVFNYFPELNSVTGSKSVFVERFNAPGSKEESPRRALDREGEEMSPNIPLPFRNIKIRQPFYRQLAQHNPQFGSGSTYALLPDTGIVDAVTIHKINRNRLPGNDSINDFFDNGYVTNAIPRTDIQYSWITASSTTTSAELRGYQSFRTSTYNRNMAFDDIDFITGSVILDEFEKEHFVDNLFINSLIKDQKSVDTETNTYSIQPTLQASLAEAVNTPYTFTSWVSMRLGDLPVPRKLKKDNIISLLDSRNISIQKEGENIYGYSPRRGWTTTNLQEPLVTFKYRPLEHHVKFGENGDLYQIDNEYVNTISLFANKEVTQKLDLLDKENKKTFYDYFLYKYKKPQISNMFYQGHEYKEIIWPKEERTGLSQTRKREAYYLDKPGFDRDGYDRQLGTQRVFWREKQQDRKRSNNTDGGYYSSMGYLSTEETGSSFHVEGTLDLIDGNSYKYISEFSQSQTINKGIYNSISFMETTSSESVIFTSSVQARQNNAYIDYLTNYSKKYGIAESVLGEANNIFIDSFGLSYISGSDIVRDLGTFYRNTPYKSLLSTRQYEDNSLRSMADKFSIIRTEDDEIKINPKLKYVSFIGGGELNISQYVQENAKEDFEFDSETYENINSTYVTNDVNFGDEIEISGDGNTLFVYSPGDDSFNSPNGSPVYGTISVYTRDQNLNWNYEDKFALGNAEINLLFSDRYETDRAILRSNRDGTILFVGTPSVKITPSFSAGGAVTIYRREPSGWELKTLIHPRLEVASQSQPLTKELTPYLVITDDIGNTNEGEANFGAAIAINSVGNQLYVGSPTDYSTDTGGSDLNGGSVYSFRATIDQLTGEQIWTLFDKLNSVDIPSLDGYNALFGSALAYKEDTSTLYVTNADHSYAGKNLFYCNTQYAPLTVMGSIELVNASNWIMPMVYNNGYLYLFDPASSIYIYSTSISGVPSIYQRFDAQPVSSNTGGNNNIFSVSNEGDLMIASYSSVNRVDIYSRKTSIYEKVLEISGSFLDIGDLFGSSVALDDQRGRLLISADKYDTPSYNNLGIIYDYDLSSLKDVSTKDGFFSQTYSIDDILFSTLDNGLQRTTEKDSGKKPFFDSYEEYLEDIYPLTKEYSQVPEFRISENLEDYVISESFWRGQIPKLSIDGIDENNYALYKNNSIQTKFANEYCTSDILKKHEQVYLDNKDISELDNIKIKVSGIKKLLPYNGFYPQDRIIQIANKYSKYIDDNLAGGVLNISYEDTTVNIQALDYREGDLLAEENYHLESIMYGDYYIVALSLPKYDNLTGLVKLFISSGDPTNINNWRENNVLTLVGERPNDRFGSSLKLVLSSEGVHLLVGATGPNNGSGQIYTSTSINGTDWTPLQAPVELKGTTGAGVGGSMDALWDVDTNKFYVCSGNTYGTALYIAESANFSIWNLQEIVNDYNFYNGIGESISMFIDEIDKSLYIYSSSPYNQFELNRGIWGQIHRFKSDPVNRMDFGTYTTYLNTKIIEQDFNNDGMGIGTEKIKAVGYGGRHYIFYQVAAVFHAVTPTVIVAYSDNDWSTYDSQIIKSIHEPKYAWPSSWIDARADRGILYYSFVSGDKIYTGTTDDGINFAKDLELDIVSDIDIQIGGTLSILSNTQTAPNIFYTDNRYLYVTSYQEQLITLNAVVSGSGVEKAWKHAAMEPLFGPGIVYNTIKSGISVDWPCLTGSIAYKELDSGIVINPFYPAPKLMKEHRTDGGLYNMQGSLRSVINYRVPFDNILYPQEIFTEKTEVIQNLYERYRQGEQIPSNSAISQFISKCYIYGGYEPYVNPFDVGDVYGQTAKRFSVPFVYSKENIKDDGLYSLAMNNFMAESVNFFLEEGKLVTFESKPDNEWPEFKAGKTYYMDVVLQKSNNLVMIEAWHSDKHPIGENGEKMNGRYFGYPVNKTTKELWEGEDLTEQERELIHNDPAYAPYTPPYFEGIAKARLSFTPEVDGKYSVTQVIENIVVEDIFVEAAKGWENGSHAHLNKMSVAESIDFAGISKVVRSEIRSRGESVETTVLTELPENKKWIISPRFETPVLDFSDQKLESYEKNYLKTSGYGRGMWSGYGKIPEGSKGIFLGLSYPFNSRFLGYSRQEDTSSLLKHVGFKAQRKKIGKISTKNKTIRESVVLVPYLEKYDVEYNDSNLKLGENIYPIKISKSEYRQQMDRIESGRNASGEKQTTSITRMVESLKKYVIPPEMNFVDNNSLSPFAMYLFEFERELSPQDLADIWQGLMPSISHDAELQEIEIAHTSEQDEIFHGKPIPQNLRWLVFRVKQKAIYDYGKVTSSTKDDQRFAQNTIVGKSDFPYSYNWPYDYFSLVEFAKVEMELSYKKK